MAAAALALGLAGGPASAGGGKAKVKANNYDFVPKTINVPVGTKVVWKGVEGVHTVTAKGGGFDREFGVGEKVKKTFNKAGTWKYVCRFHIPEKMKGKVVVG